MTNTPSRLAAAGESFPTPTSRLAHEEESRWQQRVQLGDRGALAARSAARRIGFPRSLSPAWLSSLPLSHRRDPPRRRRGQKSMSARDRLGAAGYDRDADRRASRRTTIRYWPAPTRTSAGSLRRAARTTSTARATALTSNATTDDSGVVLRQLRRRQRGDGRHLRAGRRANQPVR